MPGTADMNRILEETFKSVRKGRLLRHVRLFTEWPKIVGEVNARMARPMGIRGGTLILKSEDAAWADRLKYIEEELIERIAERIGEGIVRRIRFVIGELPGPGSPRRRPKKPSPEAEARIHALLDTPELAGKDALKQDLEKLLFTLSAGGTRRERNGE